jgi:pilus assembly protein CpaF
VHDLDELAADLRDRLLAAAADPAENLGGRIRELVDREAAVLDADARAELAGRIAERAFGLGPLGPLLADPAVEEVMVCGTAPVWVERGGRLERTAVRFAEERDLRDAIERILAPLGRRVDEAEPLCDARLPDGSRVNVVIPPLALDGPVLTIRRFRRRGFTADELVANGTLTRPLLDFLARAVRARASILVCGGTGSGKTTTLNVLSGFIGTGERVVTIEDAAELRLSQPHVIRLEARPPNLEGRGEVTIRRLVRNALRMRPDRIVVGEVRGPEALDMLSALSTGHDGSLSTIHAGTPAEALRRVETLALMAGLGLPHAALREQVADAFDLVVCQARAPDGTRRVVAVAEVVRVAGGPAARELYVWHGGRGRWRAALSEALAARLAAAEPGGPMAAPSDEAEPRGSTRPPRDDPRAALEASAIVAPP